MREYKIEYIEHYEQFIPWIETTNILAENEHKALEIFALLYGAEVVSIELN